MADRHIGDALSIEAQSNIIGSMLIDNCCVGDVMAAIDAEDFTSATYKSTFQAIKRLFTSGRAVDPTLVIDEVQGGQSYIQFLRECMSLTPTAANVLEYCKILRERTRLLRLRDIGDSLSKCFDRSQADELVARANTLMVDNRSSRVVSAAEAAKDFIERMRNPVPDEYLTWGFRTLDETLYVELGDVVLIGGRPSAGKTLLSANMAVHHARYYRVGYYSLETRTKKMVDRILSSISQVPLPCIKDKTFTAYDWQAMSEAAVKYGKLKLDHIDAAGMTVQDIVSTALSRRHQIIYIDYMQLIAGSGRSTYERVSNISIDLHLAAQANKITVIALAQLSRAERNKKDAKDAMISPSMTDFRDSGQIEQDADVALLLWVEDPTNYGGNRVLKIGKNKEGQGGTLTLSFDGARQTMRELVMDGKGRVISGQVRFEPCPDDIENPFK